LTGFIKAMQRSYDSSLAAGHSQPGKILTFDEFNFQFRSPDRPWMPFDASKINKVSKLSFMRRFPDAYFFLIPEKIGPKARFTTEQLADIGKANMQAVATSSRVVSESPLQVGGLSGLLVELEAQVGSYQLHYHNWYCFTNGYAYQLLTTAK